MNLPQQYIENTILFVMPKSSIFFKSAFVLPALMSLHTNTPVCPNFAPSCVLFPPEFHIVPIQKKWGFQNGIGDETLQCCAILSPFKYRTTLLSCNGKSIQFFTSFLFNAQANA